MQYASLFLCKIGGSMIDYQGSKWKKKRQKILRRDEYKDKVAKYFGRAIDANTVHHIYPVDEYPEYQWCDWNLISVSKETHNKLENRKTGELTELGRWLMQITRIPEEYKKIPPPT